VDADTMSRRSANVENTIPGIRMGYVNILSAIPDNGDWAEYRRG
jgi:hypothetical protein